MTKQTTTATPEAVKFYYDCEKTLINLFCRWQDEKDYEDIADYAAPLKPIADKAGVVIIKMNKRPFGCDFTVSGKTFRLSLNARGTLAYKRIA